MAIFHFPIADDDEMLIGVERVEAFLRRYDNPGFLFRFNGRGTSSGGNECVVELEFDDPEAGEEAFLVWRAYRCLSLER